MAVRFDTYCGLSCEECTFREEFHCGGCIATEGKPFHGSCEVAECAKSRHKRFCGECENIACEILTRYSNNPEHGDNPPGARIDNCQRIKKALVEEGRKGVNPVSVCGHHCDYCFMGQWCGGCRSNYNCCSFATICEGGVCPNAACAASKKLKACYECDELMDCKKGYYGKENEYVAKATALFCKKYGEECYTSTLKRAIDAGIQYTGDFDKTGSVEAALALLEQYL